MIIKGTEHSSARNLARYLLTAKENETCRLWEIRDSASDALAKSLSDWEMIGHCKTKGSKILYHAHIRISDDERMNEAQWYETIAKLEEHLGFTNCPRAIVSHEHSQKGLHVHIVWSRYDPTRTALVKLSNDHQEHHRVARQAEKDYGLRPVVAPVNDNTRRKRRLSDREVHAIKERGSSREQLTKLLQAAWNSTDSGEELRAMLKSLKIELIPGDRRDWVVQYKGMKLNPVRLLPDVNTAGFRQRMQDVDLETESRKQREAEAVKRTFRRKAQVLMKQDIETALKSGPEPQSGFRKVSRRAPQPKLRRKLRLDDPGI
jgi:hypothetical protein